MQLRCINTTAFDDGFTSLTVGKEYTAEPSKLDGMGFFVFDDDGLEHHFSGLKNGPDEYGFDPATVWENV